MKSDMGSPRLRVYPAAPLTEVKVLARILNGLTRQIDPATGRPYAADRGFT